MHYFELICNTTIIDLSTSPTHCCFTTLGKLICCFWLSSPCTSDDRDSAWLTLGMTYHKALWTMLLMNGATDFRPVWMKQRTFWTLAVIFWVKCRLVLWINWMFY